MPWPTVSIALHEEKRIAQQADCQLKCENVLDAIDGTGIYKAAVLHAIVEVNLNRLIEKKRTYIKKVYNKNNKK